MPAIDTIEKTVLDYLAAQLTPIPVYMEVPEDPPATMVIIEKTGGGERDKIKTATLAIQSYAPTLFEASQLNETVKLAIGSVDITSLFAAKLNSDYNYTDTSTKKYRYQAVFDFYYNF